MIEVFVNLVHLTDLVKGKPVLAKVNYQGQLDVKLLLDPSKYDIIVQKGDSMVTIRRKRFRNIFKKGV